VSGAHSGRRPELHDEARDTRNHEVVPRNEAFPAGNRLGSAGTREITRVEMKSETANAPAQAEEGRCASCGEEILPVPT
jgi:hypothetical protein